MLRSLRNRLLIAVALFASGASAFAQVVPVTPIPGDPIASGQALLNAVAGINNAGWGRRYVVQLQPGVYNLGDERLVMKPFVDIAGSGIEGTYVFGNGHDLQANGIQDGLIHAAGNAELRDLTLRVYPAPGRDGIVGIFVNGQNARLTRLRVQAFGLDANYCAGLVSNHAAPEIREVSINARCNHNARGLVFQSSHSLVRPVLDQIQVNIRAEQPGALAMALVFQEGAFPSRMQNSSLTASSAGKARAVSGLGPSGFALDPMVFQINHSSMQALSDTYDAKTVELPQHLYPEQSIAIFASSFSGAPTEGQVSCIAVRDADLPAFLAEDCPSEPADSDARHVIIGWG